MCDHAGWLKGERVHAHVGSDGHDGRMSDERPLVGSSIGEGGGGVPEAMIAFRVWPGVTESASSSVVQ